MREGWIPPDQCIKVFEERYLQGMKVDLAQRLPREKAKDLFEPRARRKPRRESLPTLSEQVRVLPCEQVAEKTGLSVEVCKQALEHLRYHWSGLDQHITELKPFIDLVEEIAGDLPD